MIEKFSLKSLADIDAGRVREAFEQAIARCEADCKDRPAVEAARKVTLTVSMSPVIEADGEMGSCNLQFQITDSVPMRKSKVYNMKSARGGLLWNELSPDEINQTTIDEPKPREVSHAG